MRKSVFGLALIMVVVLGSFAVPPVSGAIAIGEVKGLKDYEIEGDRVVKGYWWLTVDISNNPAGDIKMFLGPDDLKDEIDEDTYAQAANQIHLEFRSTNPFYRGKVVKYQYVLDARYVTHSGWWAWEQETYHDKWMYFYVWKVIRWVDSTLPYHVEVWNDNTNTLIDEADTMIGGQWGQDYVILKDDEGHQLKAYNLGFLNSGMELPPIQEVYLFFDPQGRMKAALAKDFEDWMSNNEKTCWIETVFRNYPESSYTVKHVGIVTWIDDQWRYFTPTYDQLYNYIGMDEIPTIDATPFVPDSSLANVGAPIVGLGNTITNTLTLDHISEYTWHTYFKGDSWESWKSTRNFYANQANTWQDTGTYCIYKMRAGSVSGIVTLEIDPQFVNTYVWYAGGGEPRIVEVNPPEIEFEYNQTGKVWVTVQNVGRRTDTFRGYITFDEDGWSYEDVSGALSIAPGGQATFEFNIRGPYVHPGEDASTDFTVTIYSTTDHTKQDTARGKAIKHGETTGGPPLQKGTVTGIVLDGETEEPIPLVVVYATGAPRAYTDANGTFSLSGVPAGEPVTVKFRRAGYEDANVVVTVPPNETHDMGTIYMTPKQVVDLWWLLPAVGVIAFAVGLSVIIYFISKKKGRR